MANLIEVLERFAYYGIYFGFGIYMEHLGYSRDKLGATQSLFLLVSYGVPVISGSFADRFGFKKVLLVSYGAYLPSIALLILTKSFSGIALTMLSIGLAAGIFKPLIAGTVRVTTDISNKSLGFGVFYAMVNVGGTFGPIVAGKLRAISWNYAFAAAAAAIGFMLVITLLFYKEPPRRPAEQTLAQKLREISVTLSDLRFAVFLGLLGVFFWLPFWSFYNLCAVYVQGSLDTARLYLDMRSVLGQTVANFFSSADQQGVRRVLAETISNTGYVIIVFQLAVTRGFQRMRALPAFMVGLGVAGLGLAIIGAARIFVPSLVFLGIFLFAVGEMISSPRIQEYITWIAPKEKAGLYMGSNFLATMIGGATSGVTYTSLSGYLKSAGHPEWVWYVMAVNLLIGVAVFWGFIRIAGEFREQDA